MKISTLFISEVYLDDFPIKLDNKSNDSTLSHQDLVDKIHDLNKINERITNKLLKFSNDEFNYTDQDTWNELKSNTNRLIKEINQFLDLFKTHNVEMSMKPINNKEKLSYNEQTLNNLSKVQENILNYSNDISLFFSLIEKGRKSLS